MRNDSPFSSFQKYFQLELIENTSAIASFRRKHEARLPHPAEEEEKPIQELFQLRHRVYCEEFEYEPTQFDGIEIDNYDQRSWHAVLRYRGSNNDKPTGQLAGCVRIVFAEQTGDQPILPLQEHYHNPFFDDAPTPTQYPANSICEISRLAVHPDFRRRAKEEEAKEGAISMPAADQARTFPLLAAGLFAAAAAIIFYNKKEHMFVIMEPKLQHRLHRIEKIRFTQIGEPIHFRGKRAPYYLESEQAQTDVRQSPNLGPLYQIVRGQLGFGS